MPPKRMSNVDESKGSTVKRPGSDLTSSTSSPLKRVKAAILDRDSAEAVREKLVLSTVEDFRAHVQANETVQSLSPDIEVVVKGTLIWKSFHTFGTNSLVRLHLTDANPSDSVEELQELERLYGASDKNRGLVDDVLLTVTVFGETSDSTKLPANGSTICITNSRKRIVYDGKKCQLVAKASDITIL